MKSGFLPVALIAVCACFAGQRSNTSVDSGVKNGCYTPMVVGIGLLSAEFIGGPIIAKSVWWQYGFHWDNPFKYVGENEPYLEDDAWHFWSTNTFTEYHYQVLSRCFHYRYAVPLASALTFITWTGVECLDALDIRDRWLFSWSDERANCLGIAFWLFKHYYPNIPIEVRIGMRKWEKIIDYPKRAFTALKDYDAYAREHRSNYANLKVEAIYKVYDELYAGIALSKYDVLSNRNLWGITMGYDFIKKLNEKKTGWWNEPLYYVSKYSAITLGFTYWMQ
jgi:hypothetical protein